MALAREIVSRCLTNVMEHRHRRGYVGRQVRASFELIFDHPGVASAIIGTINPAHLAANVATAVAVLQDIC